MLNGHAEINQRRHFIIARRYQLRNMIIQLEIAFAVVVWYLLYYQRDCKQRAPFREWCKNIQRYISDNYLIVTHFSHPQKGIYFARFFRHIKCISLSAMYYVLWCAKLNILLTRYVARQKWLWTKIKIWKITMINRIVSLCNVSGWNYVAIIPETAIKPIKAATARTALNINLYDDSCGTTIHYNLGRMITCMTSNIFTYTLSSLWLSFWKCDDKLSYEFI